MGHITSKGYIDLQKRLDKSPQGAPASDALFKILEILFSEEEASLVSKLPINLVTVKKAAKIWKKSEKEAKKILNTLADKGLMFDIKYGNTETYMLAPTMAGFFEFSLMRTDGKFDTKVLSELFYQYINEEDAFMRQVLGLKPPIARTLVQEDTVNDQSEILDYERATHVIKTAECITVGRCYCRHKMEHMGKACDMPQDVCLSFNNPAKSLAKHGIAKKISKKEAMKILDKCISLGLVQIGDNVQNRVGWICNCCGCCCEALLAYKKLGYTMRVHSNYEANVNDKCIGCGACVQRCPVDAIKIKNGKAVVDKKWCIGCGVCSRFCPKETITMERRKEINFVPVDSFERYIMGAINSGKLQNLIFDNYGLWTHAMFRKMLEIIFKLPPAKQLLANRQLQSRFIQGLTKAYRIIYREFDDKRRADYSHPELNAD